MHLPQGIVTLRDREAEICLFQDILKTYTDLEASPMILNGHTMETDEPVCVLICLDV